MKMLLVAVVVLGGCATKAPVEKLELGPTNFAPGCNRDWNPYGKLPDGCDIGCAHMPVHPAPDPMTHALVCPDGAPCIDQPACKLAVNRDDSPRVDCAETFITDDGARGCCVEPALNGGLKIELFYECP